MSNKKTLQVGDVVYRVGVRQGAIGAEKIDRVTAKFAFSGHRKFKIETAENGYVTEAGTVSYAFSYWIETPERKAEFERQELIRLLNTAVNASGTSEKVKALSNDQIRLMLNILNDTEK